MYSHQNDNSVVKKDNKISKKNLYFSCHTNKWSLWWQILPENFIPVEGESKSIFYNVFASITEHSFLCICKVFISKEFVRFSYSLGR